MPPKPKGKLPSIAEPTTLYHGTTANQAADFMAHGGAAGKVLWTSASKHGAVSRGVEVLAPITVSRLPKDSFRLEHPGIGFEPNVRKIVPIDGKKKIPADAFSDPIPVPRPQMAKGADAHVSRLKTKLPPIKK